MSFPIKHGDFPWFFVCLPEGIYCHLQSFGGQKWVTNHSSTNQETETKTSMDICPHHLFFKGPLGDHYNLWLKQVETHQIEHIKHADQCITKQLTTHFTNKQFDPYSRETPKIITLSKLEITKNIRKS